MLVKGAPDQDFQGYIWFYIGQDDSSKAINAIISTFYDTPDDLLSLHEHQSWYQNKFPSTPGKSGSS